MFHCIRAISSEYDSHTRPFINNPPLFNNPYPSLNRFLEKTYLPGEYKNASVGLTDVIKWYQNVTNTVLQDLYKIYFPDFTLFEYAIEDFLK